MSTASAGLIVAATGKEIAPFLEHYRQQPAAMGNWDVLITGAGSVATTYHLSRYLFVKKPALVFMAGIAGSFSDRISLGTVVAVGADRLADEGVIEGGELKTLSDLGLQPPNQFPFQKGWLKNDSALLKKISLKKVKAITVNQVTNSKRMMGCYREKFNPAIESMEGAALHYVCAMEKVPYLQLRAVSNYVGERNKNKWNFKEAIFNLNRELIALCSRL